MTVDNVILTNITIIGSNSVGGLVGTAVNSVILNNSISGSVRGRDRVGGLIGNISLGRKSVENNITSGSIKGEDDVGGLIGYSLGIKTFNNKRFLVVVFKENND